MTYKKELQAVNKELVAANAQLCDKIRELESLCSQTAAEQKQIEAKIAYLASFPHLNPNPVLEVNLKGDIVFYNPATERLLATLGLSDLRQLFPTDMDEILRTCTSLVTQKESTQFYREIKLQKRTFSLDLQWAPEFASLRIYAADITEREQATADLQTVARRYQALFDNAALAIFQTTLEGKIIEVNPEFARMFGYESPEEALHNIENVANHFADPNRRQEIIRMKMEDPTLTTFENLYRRRDGSTFLGKLTVRQFPDPKRSLCFEGFIEDITQRKQAEEALRGSEERYRLIFDSNMVGIGFWGSDGEVFAANDAYLSLTHHTRTNLDSRSINWHALTPPDYQSVDARAVTEILNTGRCTPYEKEYLLEDGTRIPVIIGGALVQREPLIGIAFALDITERKQAEEKLQRALHEKETLLRELYHRTKNNMNVIIAMLSLRADYSQNEDAVQILHEVENKIRAMALVHQKLYQSQDLSRVDLKEYVADLATLLLQSHWVYSGDITLNLECENVLVTIDVAIPCGLVLSELFSNAFKHAFPAGRRGEIRLTLTRNDQDIELIFADDGVGAPEDFDFRTRPTLGLQTIFTVVEHQLQGSVQFKTNRGVTCHIRFSDTQYTARI